jgi:hypothetical protein
MKKIGILICGLALAGCNANSEWAKISMAVGQIDNTLAKLSGGSIPKACAIIAVADSYFQDLKDNISAKNIAIEAKAMAAVQVICNNPPTNTVAAFRTLVNLWKVVQDSTKTN